MLHKQVIDLRLSLEGCHLLRQALVSNRMLTFACAEYASQFFWEDRRQSRGHHSHLYYHCVLLSWSVFGISMLQLGMRIIEAPLGNVYKVRCFGEGRHFPFQSTFADALLPRRLSSPLAPSLPVSSFTSESCRRWKQKL